MTQTCQLAFLVFIYLHFLFYLFYFLPYRQFFSSKLEFEWGEAAHPVRIHLSSMS